MYLRALGPKGEKKALGSRTGEKGTPDRVKSQGRALCLV